MRVIRAFSLGAAIWGGAAGLSVAQAPGGINFVELFQDLDANGDRVIEKTEVPPSAHSAFETLLEVGDANKNGKIDEQEYRELLLSVRDEFEKSLPRTEERFKAADKDGDGKLSRAEFPGPPMLFDRIDTNKDGSIAKQEALSFQLGQGAGAGGGDRFKAMDKDGDGKLSRAELPGLPGIFSRLDADGDGAITREEAARFPNALNGVAFLQRLKAMDEDGDGKVSKDEFIGPPAVFDNFDRNGDGFLSREDFPAMAAAGGGPGPGGGGAERFKAADKDGDGKLSRKEWFGRPAMFDRIDADKDGFLTPSELRQAFSPGKRP